jgi:hypothetical protein
MALLAILALVHVSSSKGFVLAFFGFRTRDLLLFALIEFQLRGSVIVGKSGFEGTYFYPLCIFTHTHTYTYSYSWCISTRTHTRTSALSASLHTHIYIYTHTYTYFYSRCIYTHIHIHNIYTCFYPQCISTHIHRHIHILLSLEGYD